MRAIRTSGLMSGGGKRGGAQAPVLAPILDSTNLSARMIGSAVSAETCRSVRRDQRKNWLTKDLASGSTNSAAPLLSAQFERPQRFPIDNEPLPSPLD